MINKPELHQALLLVFFAFLGGLTRELNDLISNKINFKNFAIGVITAITTGLILGKIMLGTGINEDLAYGLAGLSGFVGPHILYILAKSFENRLEHMLQEEKRKEI